MNRSALVFRALRVLSALMAVMAVAACGGGGAAAPTALQPEQPTLFALAVNASGTGAVESTPSGISCNTLGTGTCTASFAQATTVTLRASPLEGSVFVGWSGSDVDCPGTADCTVTVDKAHTVVATFTLPAAIQRQMDIDVRGQGAVTSQPAGLDCPTTCTAYFDSGREVVLTALAYPGYHLAGWSVSGGQCAASSNTCAVTMDSARTVSVNFVADPLPLQTLAVTISGDGSVASAPTGITCPGTCSQAYEQSTVVTLVAQPKSGAVFTEWTGACSGNGACVVTMDAARSVGASFAVAQPSSYALNVAYNTNGRGRIVSAPSGIDCGSACSQTFPAGTQVALTAVPDVGYAFGGWSGACSGAGACLVSMNSTQTVLAVFSPILQSVLVTRQGSGSVVSSPAGINCGSTCSAQFGQGTAVTLSAAPAAGYVFAGWQGACTGTAACALPMASDAAVTARFDLVTYDLALAVSGTGSVQGSPGALTCASTCTQSFAQGTVVTLTAVPAAGQAFSGWSGACSGTGSCVVTMSAARSVTATFAPIPPVNHALNLAVSGLGSVTSAPGALNCGADCTRTFAEGTAVTLTAIPASGRVFAGWSGGCTGTALTCTVTMSAATTVSAKFDPVMLALSVAVQGQGGVTSVPAGISCGTTCSASFAQGTNVTLTATAASGSVFTSWSGVCSGSSATCVVPMSAAKSVTATFVPSYALAATVIGNGSVSSTPAGLSCSTTCSAKFVEGTSVTLVAAPSAGAAFTGWSGACTGASSTCVVAMSAAKSVTANFVDQVAVTVSVTGSGSVSASPAGIACPGTCSAVYAKGSSVTLTAAASAGNVLSSWGGVCSGSASTCVVSVDAAKSVSATFVPTYALTTTVSGSGSVSSAPAGINCGATCSASFAQGTSVTLTAAPVAGNVFTGWSGACTGATSTCVVSMTAAKSATATFLPLQTLSVAVTGLGGVGSSPAGISCSANCSAQFTQGTSVTLSATPTTGNVFTGWGGACTATATTCVVSLTAAKSVTATFVPSYTLTVSVGGFGTITSYPAGINCGSQCSAGFASGTSVTLTATAQSGNVFTGWTGACTGSALTCTTTLSAARSVSAAFAEAAVSACDGFYAADFALNSSTTTVATVGTNAKPTKGVAVADPAYKTCVVRVTNHAAEAPVDFARNDYSRRQAFNADSSLQLIYALDGYWHVYKAVSNQYLTRLTGPAADAEPQWHPTNPNLLYYLPTYGIGLKMYELNVSTGAVRTVADFGARLKARWSGANAAWTRSEGSPSADGRYWCFMVDNSAWGSVGVFTYDLQQDQILGYYDTNGDRPDHVSMSPSGKYCVVSSDSALGTTAFTKDFSSSVKLHHKSEHSDLALNAAGEDVYVAVDYEATQGEVFMVNMNTGVRTLLFPTYVNGTTTALHVSGKAFSKPGWAVVSTYSRTGTQQWLHEKVMAVQLAANPTVYSLAYHRSLYNQYWTAPVASVNRDFTKVTFNSNWGVNSTTDVDAYRIELPAGVLK